jgi:hypothetical protein
MEKRGARFYGDYLPFLRLENIEIHRYVCFRCGHFETFQFDPMSYVRKPTPFKKK